MALVTTKLYNIKENDVTYVWFECWK